MPYPHQSYRHHSQKTPTKQMAVIVDMSSPNRASINDGITPSLTSLSYIYIQDVIKQIMDLDPRALLSKIDIKSTYRIVPVHSSDRPLLGMSFQQHIYINATLPFGLRSTPKVFNSLADALIWTLKQHGVSHLLHYLDDFITMGLADNTQCQINCDIIHNICELLGVPLAKDKCEGSRTLLEYLGFLLDTIKMTVSLPKEKLNRLLDLIQLWSNRMVCTKHNLDSFIGQLQHASAAGHSFLHHMIILSKSRRLPSHPICLNQGFHSDLAWWHLFLKQWNGISPMSAIGRDTPKFIITSDTSGSWGCGAGRLALEDLDSLIQFYFEQGLSSSTHCTYTTGINCFTKFCTDHNIHDPFPLSQPLLCYFVSYLANQGLLTGMIKVYLSALCHKQVALGFPDPQHSAMPKLKLIAN